MTHAIQVHTTIESENLRIPELRSFVGKRVKVTVVEDEPATADEGREELAELTPGTAVPARRQLGSLRGLLKVPDDFDDPLPEEILRSFEGKDDE